MELLTIVQIAIGIVFLFVVYDSFKPVKDLQQLTEKEIKEKIAKSKDVVLVDVRNPYEYKAKHIEGAINLPLSKIKRKKVDVPTNKEIILYCQTGIRSKQAAKVLRRRYKDVSLSHLAGGLYNWQAESAHKGNKK